MGKSFHSPPWDPIFSAARRLDASGFVHWWIHRCCWVCQCYADVLRRWCSRGAPEKDLDILMPGMVQTCSNPINNGIIIILGGAGFCPSTVIMWIFRTRWKSDWEIYTHKSSLTKIRWLEEASVIFSGQKEMLQRTVCHVKDRWMPWQVTYEYIWIYQVCIPLTSLA